MEQATPSDPKPSAGGVPHRELRRFYKVTLAESFERWEREGRAPGCDDCLRCLLAARGAPLLGARPVRTGTLPVPEGRTELAEALLAAGAAAGGGALRESPGARWPYAETMALSTAVGATLDARVNLANDPPAARVVGRRMEREPPVREAAHACLRLPRPPPTHVERVAIWYRVRGERGEQLRGAPQRHAVVYAAPGFGKTTLQHRLAGAGVLLADTDDVPGASRAHVRQLLQWTSVLTNRLDLLDPALPTLAFVPADARVLRRRGVVRPLGDDDLRYWCGLHRFPDHRRIVRVELDRSCLTDWLCVDAWPAPPDARVGSALEAEFLRKVRALGGTTDEWV